MSLGEMASVADKCYNDIATDMSVGQLLSYASAAKGMSMETISFYAVPGQPGYYSPRAFPVPTIRYTKRNMWSL